MFAQLCIVDTDKKKTRISHLKFKSFVALQFDNYRGEVQILFTNRKHIERTISVLQEILNSGYVSLSNAEIVKLNKELDDTGTE